MPGYKLRGDKPEQEDEESEAIGHQTKKAVLNSAGEPVVVMSQNGPPIVTPVARPIVKPEKR